LGATGPVVVLERAQYFQVGHGSPKLDLTSSDVETGFPKLT